MKFVILCLAFVFFLSSCSSSHLLDFTQKTSTDTPYDDYWNIEVIQNQTNHNFQVFINDIKVIDKPAAYFSVNIETKVVYKNKEIKLIINYSYEFTGTEKIYVGILYIDNELIGMFDF